MKCLSVLQPYASLIALAGHPDPEVRRLAKRFETRSWPTKYRGPLAIHASKGFPREAKDRCWLYPFYQALSPAGLVNAHISADKNFKLPLGAVIATCRLVDCKEICPDGFARKCDTARVENIMPILPEEPELSFGDYTPGRFAWNLWNVRMLPEPVPAKGRLGLWEWTPTEGVIIDG